MRQAEVYINKTLAGILTETDDRKYIFRYTDHYFNTKSSKVVSVNLPLSQQEYHSDYLFPFFFNMLSEGVNKQRYCRLFKIDDNDDFGLLLATADEDTIGNVNIKRIK
ncbi:HipA N-terminal domain-containing protein [Bacteroides sp. 519]|uniref:HipA N-terminal domain-containing protein n=1 Tax=Bacteroides sp. 519 TaxID=2302937 RepID=UPI0013D11C7E|nr:HipA N-terminal domain-containing protein [Bacteroides sp. 519]NDV58484.1 phosphatidylinositol kinase [Bacteroides sp. 519]